MSAVINNQAVGNCCLNSNPGLTVQRAYSIDKKIDDGLPQLGNVTSIYLDTSLPTGNPYSFYPVWAADGNMQGANDGYGNPTTAAIPGSSTTCYDNGNVAGQPQQYSVEISNGANVNCALSFRFQ
jgi:hypothetical protein